MTASLALLDLLGAVALLLWGLRMVRTAAERALDRRLERALGRIAGNRAGAFGFGLCGAAVLQSSTAMVLLVAGFAGRGRIATAGALAVALGADLGTALAAQILVLDIRDLAPAAILAGLVLFRLEPSKGIRDAGRGLIGFGLVLTALHLILGVAATMRESETIGVLLGAIAGEPPLAILLAALIAWLAHSSLALVLLIASLAGAGMMTLPAALFLVLGANLGAALPAFVATLAAPPGARRVAAGNLLFRGTGVLAVALLAGPFLHLVPEGVLGADRAAMLFHLAFNAALALAGLALAPAAARLLARLLPDPSAAERAGAAPRHLDPAALGDPRRALGLARREALRLAELVEDMLRASEAAFARGAGGEPLATITAREAEIDRLNTAIKLYVTELSRAALSAEESRQALSVISFATNMEHAGDIIDGNIRRLAERKRKGGLEFSEAGAAELARIFAQVREALHGITAAFMADDEGLAGQMIAEKHRFRDAELAATAQHLERLRERNVASMETSGIHLDLLRDLKRVHSHLTAIAYSITERGIAVRG